MKLTKKIYISGDHAGFELKEKVKVWLEKCGYSVKDYGPLEHVDGDDYPDYVIPMAKAVSRDKKSIGIMIAGSGIGEVIAANKVKGIRAVLFHGGNLKKLIWTARVHDNANVLSFGSRFVSFSKAKKAIKLFLETKFKGEARHKRRLGKIEKFERSKK